MPARVRTFCGNRIADGNNDLISLGATVNEYFTALWARLYAMAHCIFQQWLQHQRQD